VSVVSTPSLSVESTPSESGSVVSLSRVVAIGPETPTGRRLPWGLVCADLDLGRDAPETTQDHLPRIAGVYADASTAALSLVASTSCPSQEM
jgi:hypothetical protein